MTNRQIIITESALHGIAETVHTYEGWKARSYQVQRGQRALFKAKIWKPVRRTGKDGEEHEKMLLVNAAFFGESQVREMEVA